MSLTKLYGYLGKKPTATRKPIKTRHSDMFSTSNLLSWESHKLYFMPTVQTTTEIDDKTGKKRQLQNQEDRTFPGVAIAPFS